MRVIIYIVLGLLVGLVKTFAQTETKTETTSESSSTTVSINGDVLYDGGDLSFAGNENSYFSTSDSDNTFRVRAKFNDRKTAKIRTYLLKELGDENISRSGNKQEWKMKSSGDTQYEVKLDEGSLRIFVDKEVASSQLFNKFKTITRNIKSYTSGNSNKKREEEKAQREEQQLEREAEQLIREAEQKLREAERLKREAERLKREAKRKQN